MDPDNRIRKMAAKVARLPARIKAKFAEDEQAAFGTVPLAKRVGNWIERTEAGIQIDLISSMLSILSVITYMIETHYSYDDPYYEQLRRLDLFCSILFLVEWCFWLWLAHDRFRYIFQAQSMLDLVTSIPIMISFFIDHKAPGVQAMESMVRLLRVLRVFRVFRLGKRLRNEVQVRLLTIIFTLLAIILTSAGMFYEIETRWGERYPDLKIEQAIYWSVVTTTTIGYGDISPSVVASQATLILVLLLTFTILPYQTSALVTALGETSVYQTAHYSHAARGNHIVITGHLTVSIVCLMADELYSTQDYGYPDFNIVFLSPEAPPDDMKRLLKTHKQSHHLLYLQGSCMDYKDLRRAQVEYADAVFIMCDKSPPDARQQDLQNIQACLAIGQYCLMVAKAARSTGPKPISEQITALLSKLHARLRPKKHHEGIPFMCIQLLLPESQQNLSTLLEMYCSADQHPPLSPASATATADAVKSVSNDVGAAAAAGQKAVADVAATVLRKTPPGILSTKDIGCSPVRLAAADHLPSAASEATKTASCMDIGTHWQAFSQSLVVICVSEVKYSLLGQSCVGCPGAVTLISNLVHSVDAGSLLEAQIEQAPMYAKEYLEGSSNELYEMSAFPKHMHGELVSTVVKYMQDMYDAVLIAAAGTASPDSTQQAPTGTAPVSDKKQKVALIAPLQHTITAGTSAYLIASDLEVILDIQDAPQAEYLEWKAHQARLALPPVAGQDEEQEHQREKSQQLQQPDIIQQQVLTDSSKEWETSECAIKQPAVLHDSEDSTDMLAMKQQEQHHTANVRPASANSSCLPSPRCSTPQSDGTNQQSTLHNHTISKHRRRFSSPNIPTFSPPESRADSPTTGTDKPQRRTTGDIAALFSTSAKSLLTGAYGASAAASPTHEVGTGGRKRHRGPIHVNTRPGGNARNLADTMLNMVQAHVSDMRRRLSSGSRRSRALASQQMRLLYHTRSTPESHYLKAMVQKDLLHVQGHLLVCSSGTPPSALFCLLAPLRSSSLPVVQPVVIVDTAKPAGPEWQDIARLDQVYFVQGSVQDPEVLLHANAEAAASAVLLLPWCSQGACQGPGDHSGSVDGYVLAATRNLKALNPHMQVLCELNLHQSLAFLDPMGSLLDWRDNEVAAAAATPSFMAGAVLLPQMVDSLTCQTLYNHGTPRIISQLLTQWHTQPHQPSSRDSDGGAVLLQLPVAHCHCKTFGQLFDWLVDHGMVCLGLYRKAVQDQGRVLWYIYTNPYKDVLLHDSDHAVVLLPRAAVSSTSGMFHLPGHGTSKGAAYPPMDRPKTASLAPSAAAADEHHMAASLSSPVAGPAFASPRWAKAAALVASAHASV